MIEKTQISKIGIGTWGIGGFDKRNPQNNDAQQITALTYLFDKGVNFFETTFWYSQGLAAELVAQALENSIKNRDDIFISQAIYPYDVENVQQAEEEVERFGKLFKTDHVDTLLFTMGGIQKYGFDETVGFFKKMLDAGKTRYVSLTNVNLEMLQKFHQVFGDKCFSHELSYCFEVRENEDAGIIGYAEKNGILNVIFQPLRRNKTAAHNWELLVSLAKKYQKTQNQILINWLVTRKFLPLIKSENIEHIDENLAALDFVIDPEDIRQLNEYRIPGYTAPPIDWDRTGIGVPVHTLANIFDEEYQKQVKRLV